MPIVFLQVREMIELFEFGFTIAGWLHAIRIRRFPTKRISRRSIGGSERASNLFFSNDGKSYRDENTNHAVRSKDPTHPSTLFLTPFRTKASSKLHPRNKSPPDHRSVKFVAIESY